jgi:hypothetical protein
VITNWPNGQENSALTGQDREQILHRVRSLAVSGGGQGQEKPELVAPASSSSENVTCLSQPAILESAPLTG